MSDDLTSYVREAYVSLRARIRSITDAPPVPATQDYDEFDWWLNQVKTDAWDEGHEAGQHNEHEHRPGRKITNPYREDSHD